MYWYSCGPPSLAADASPPATRLSILRRLSLVLTGALLFGILNTTMAASEDNYRLEVFPSEQTSNLGDTVEIEIWVRDATPDLDLSWIRFNLLVEPAIVQVPTQEFGEPGDFIPDAILTLVEDPVYGETTSATYSVTSVPPASGDSTEGLLVRLRFENETIGLANIRFGEVVAQQPGGEQLTPPVTGTASVEIVDPSWTPTPTVTPTQTNTPIPTPTPTQPFNVTFNPTPLQIEYGDFALVPVLIEQASSALDLSEIHFSVEIHSDPEGTFYLLPEHSVSGPFIPNATLWMDALEPQPERVYSATVHLSNGGIGGSTESMGIVANIALGADGLGEAWLSVNSIFGLKDGEGNDIHFPWIPEDIITISATYPITGCEFEGLYDRKIVYPSTSPEALSED